VKTCPHCYNGFTRDYSHQTEIRVDFCAECGGTGRIPDPTAKPVEFTCIAGFKHAPEGIRHWECAEGQRQHAEDLAVDDEINRRREHRHFEPDHFGR